MKQNLFLYAACLITGLSVCSCQQKQFHYDEGAVFGTLYHITYNAPKNLQSAMEAELAHFDDELSMYKPNSTLSQINQTDTTPFELKNHPWVERVIQRSLDYSNLTDGAFDITVAPLVNAWGFGFKQAATINQAYIDSLLTFTGYQKIRLENGAIIKSDPRIMLDVSAIAKGYACDVIASFLRKRGITDFMIEIGGEMVLSGRNPSGNDWRVGINTPNDDSLSINQDWCEKLTLTDRSLATSGNYRKYYIKDGKKYAHTIDPKTGYPVQHSLLSATVIADDCLTADALATAFMVMGVEKALSLAESIPDVEALFICSDEKTGIYIETTTGLKKWLNKTK